MIGKCLTKTLKAFRRHKRRPSNDVDAALWQSCLDMTNKLLVHLKDSVKLEQESEKEMSKVKEDPIKLERKAKAKDNASTTTAATSTGSNEEEDGPRCQETIQGELPPSATEYKSRLLQQKKDMYKDPPVLPPTTIHIHPTYAPCPTRNKTTQQLTFPVGTSFSDEDDSDNLAKLLRDFHPNRTPEEILRAGSFGGTYYRPITSAVTNVRYRPSNTLPTSIQPTWISGLDQSTMITSLTYRPSVNKYKVKCGGSLGMWESSGWIADCNPYGWF